MQTRMLTNESTTALTLSNQNSTQSLAYPAGLKPIGPDLINQHKQRKNQLNQVSAEINIVDEKPRNTFHPPSFTPELMQKQKTFAHLMQTLFKYTDMQDDDLDQIVKAVDAKGGPRRK